ncbi:unnamed protein product [Rotaria socialis]|uniref:molybdopterin molybdotransferase n=1 Tax=Rotaria socialis TaxID=392032 RepID=A0A818KKX7_9BILA|nr:unnamed protein product [Rotaria socialis]
MRPNIPKEILLKLCDELRPNLILTTGGTGINSDDMTPEETSSVINKEIPGLAQAMVVESLTDLWHLSRNINYYSFLYDQSYRSFFLDK